MKHEEYIGADAASDEARKSLMPGQRNGPADAYRHIIWAAEMTRRFGENAARAILETNEIKGDIIGKQPKDEADMDRHNNEIGVAIGKSGRTFDEVVDGARDAIDQSVPHDGNGADNTAKWLDPSTWKGVPPETNWPPDWGKVPPPEDQYPYTGEDNRYEGNAIDEVMDKPLEDMSQEDIDTLMGTGAYRASSHPDFQRIHRKVAAWFGTGEQRSGRDRPTGGGPVHVRAHDRDGGQTSVRSHTRSQP